MNKIIVFYDKSFPYEGARPNKQQLADLASFAAVVDVSGLTDALQTAQSLVYLHGQYFPKEAWTSLLGYLKRGGALLHMGGAPFRSPVYLEAGHYRAEPEQTAYHQELNIHEMLPVDAGPIREYAANPDIPLFADKLSLFSVQPTVGFVLHATKADDQPGQGGSSGPMDAHIYPLLKGISAAGREIAAPCVLIENTKGAFAGGRWLFVNQALEEHFWNAGGAEAVLEWSSFCARGVTEIWFKPNYGSYEPGDRPTFSLQLQALGRREAVQTGMGQTAPTSEWKFQITVTRQAAGGAHVIWESETGLAGSRELTLLRLPMPIAIEPGYYEAICTAVSDDGETRIYRQGFWGYDEHLLQEGELLTCDRDYFRKNGKPLPIVGMTYMTSDVARKFLFMPNVSTWDRDMAQMKRAGINYIRTGIWTAWRQVMFVDGHPSEEVLRAIDAFLLTAKRHSLEVTFTFFAFTPEAWEGVNPYLDPRSVEAQKRFVAAIVSRHAKSTHVHWDLVNEPSLFHPDKTFSGPQTCADPYEQEQFIAWLRLRHQDDIRLLQERWNRTPADLSSFDAARPPRKADINFNTTAIHPRKNGQWLDYCLFTMEMHNQWARELSATIRHLQPKQLITVGQDEALAGQRPSPFFYEEAVDYTNVHSWWLMDDLVWDTIFTKTPNKPNLVQETGMMYVETADGKAKRTELELRNILERKYAYAFATGAAGAVQWIWNINFYMHNVNESNIGALRADGTEKPEADVSYDFGQFIGGIGHLFEDRRLEETVVIYPYSNDFSARSLALAATTKLTRTMAYELKQPFRALGEYHLEALGEQPPKLIIVPSAHNFSSEALGKLLNHVKEHGGTLLFTGPISLDEYWRPTERAFGLVGESAVANVLREEVLELDGRLIPVSFANNRIAEAAKETIPVSESAACSARLTSKKIGKGMFLWCPLPVELNDRSEALTEVYDYAIGQAGVAAELVWLKGGDLPGVYGRKLAFREGALFVFVSEYAVKAEVEVTDPESGISYAFALEPERTVMFATDRTGRLLKVYRPEEVTITFNES